MSILKKCVVSIGIGVAYFGLIAAALMNADWLVFVPIGLIIGWLGAVEWKEV